MPKPYKLVLTCEHASARIPVKYRELIPQSYLRTHKGLDIGALEAAEFFSKTLRAPLIAGNVSRLVVDLNRSPHNRTALFSRFLQSLDRDKKNRILNLYYLPYRKAAERQARKLARKPGVVLHLSIHSFTPVLYGKVRRPDIGLLFDPARKSEARFCRRMRTELKRLDPGLKVLFNDPYKGISDGMTTALRKKFPSTRYAGIEVEINQKFPRKAGKKWRALKKILAKAIWAVMI
ncbi:MAG: hypothetical protein A2Z83_07840 [Omnitrophica bacterium GWA2_52_8]|nr:MAG: hypothetical protein A2Z83_07840 [Omnitrophica bacterium GWA2_52_8]